MPTKPKVFLSKKLIEHITSTFQNYRLENKLLQELRNGYYHVKCWSFKNQYFLGALAIFQHFSVVLDCLSFTAKLLLTYDVVHFGEKMAAKFWILPSFHILAAKVSVPLLTLQLRNGSPET